MNFEIWNWNLNFINVFTVTFDKFNESLPNKIISLKEEEKIQWPQIFEWKCINISIVGIQVHQFRMNK